VSIVAGAYTPASATVTVGQTVRWTATDTNAHTATSDQRLWDSGCIAPGSSYAYTFTTRGIFSYYCIYHGHRGTITVT
jgi:plastocyanin